MADSYHPYAFEAPSFESNETQMEGSWHNDPNFNRLVPVPGADTNGYSDVAATSYGMSLVNADILSPSTRPCRPRYDNAGVDDDDLADDDDDLADDDDEDNGYADVVHDVDDVMTEVENDSDLFNPLEYKGRALVYYKALVNESCKRENEQRKKDTQEDKKKAPKHKAPALDAQVISQPFELVYEAPVGRAVIPRTLYPTANNKPSEYHLIATKMLPHKRTESELHNLVEFMEQTKSGIAKKINSKIRLHFVEQLKEEGVEYQNKPVCDVKGACDAFRHELTEDLCLKLLRVFWGSVEDSDFIHRMEYQVLAESNLWYSSANDDLNCTKEKRAVGFVKSHISNQIRMNFRKRFQRDIGHGVTLKVSQAGGRNKRRKKGEFGTSDICGWNAPKHREWKKQSNSATTASLGILPRNGSKQTRSAEPLAVAGRNPQSQTVQLENRPFMFVRNAPPVNYNEEMEKVSALEVQPIMKMYSQKDAVTTVVGKVRGRLFYFDTFPWMTNLPTTLLISAEGTSQQWTRAETKYTYPNTAWRKDAFSRLFLFWHATKDRKSQGIYEAFLSGSENILLFLINLVVVPPC